MELEVLHLILEYGTTPALLLLALVVLTFKKDITKKMDELDGNLKNMNERINFIEQTYVKRDELYRDISGWKGDLRMLANKLDTIKDELFYLKGRYEELKFSKSKSS